MSEYQYYEFLAIDRPLDAAEQAEVRSLSTRARITATSFVNEYHWGNFRGNPYRLMERYYDAHLYVANWGTHRVMLRVPSGLLGPDVVEEYCVGEQLSARVTDEFIVLDFTSEDHAGEFDFDHDAEALLSTIVGVRAELADGDLRPLYVAWLAAYGAWAPGLAPGPRCQTSLYASPWSAGSCSSLPRVMTRVRYARLGIAAGPRGGRRHVHPAQDMPTTLRLTCGGVRSQSFGPQ